MPTLVRIPPAGDEVRTVTIVRWLVAEGDRVSEGEPVVEVETSKANADIFAERSGRLAARLAPPGAIVDVGAAIASIALDGEDLASVRAKAIVAHSPTLHPAVPRRAGFVARLFGLRS